MPTSLRRDSWRSHAGRWLALALVVAVTFGCAGRGPLTFDRRVREQTFDLYWKEMREEYPYFSLYGVDWEAARNEHRARALAAEDPSAFYRELAAMLGALDDEHVRIEPPPKSTWRGGWETGQPTISLVNVARRLYVRRWPFGTVYSGPASGRAGDELFPEIVSVDGAAVRRNTIKLMLDGVISEPARVEVEWADGSREVVALTRPASIFGSATGTGTSEPNAVVHPALMAGTSVERSSEEVSEFGIRWEDGSVTYLTIHAGERSQRKSKAGKASSGSAAPDDWLIAERIDDVGYLSVSTVDYEDVGGLKKMMSAFDKAVDSMIGTRAMILDLRYNGGGKPESMAAMAGRFLGTGLDLESEDRYFLGLFPYRYVTKVSPRKPVYRGELVVIINDGTGSAAEHIAKILQRSGRAKVVGQASAGAEAVVRVVRGPDRSELRFGAVKMTAFEGESFQGRGVVPDQEVALTVERIRREGYTEAVRSVEREQFEAACTLLGASPGPWLAAKPHPEAPVAANPGQGAAAKD